MEVHDQLPALVALTMGKEQMLMWVLKVTVLTAKTVSKVTDGIGRC